MHAVAVLKSDFAGDHGSRWEQAHDGERSNRFPRAGFTDQAQHFTGRDGEGKAANRRYRCSRSRLIAGNGGASGTRLGKLDGQIADIKERAHEGYGISD